MQQQVLGHRFHPCFPEGQTTESSMDSICEADPCRLDKTVPIYCCVHFTDGCFEGQFALMREFGIPAKKLLCLGAIPSLYPKRKVDDFNLAFLSLPEPKPKRQPAAKLEENRILSELILENVSTSKAVSEDRMEVPEIEKMEIDNPEPGETAAETGKRVPSTATGCQTKSNGKLSVKIQVAAKQKEKGLQVDFQPRVRSIGIQFNDRHYVREHLVITPDPIQMYESSNSEESEDQTDTYSTSVYELSSTSSNDSHLTDTHHEEYNPLEEKKFIFSASKLLELFNTCKRCNRFATASIQQRVGTMVKMVKIAAECEFCSFKWQWCSQPYLGSIPAGNIALSSSILFSGALATKVLCVLQCMDVATISSRTFTNHQSTLLFPATTRVWDKNQQDYV